MPLPRRASWKDWFFAKRAPRGRDVPPKQRGEESNTLFDGFPHLTWIGLVVAFLIFLNAVALFARLIQ
jgi:hypothetical protein